MAGISLFVLKDAASQQEEGIRGSMQSRTVVHRKCVEKLPVSACDYIMILGNRREENSYETSITLCGFQTSTESFSNDTVSKIVYQQTEQTSC